MSGAGRCRVGEAARQVGLFAARHVGAPQAPARAASALRPHLETTPHAPTSAHHDVELAEEGELDQGAHHLAVRLCGQ